jgi:hypothetical protein
VQSIDDRTKAFGHVSRPYAPKAMPPRRGLPSLALICVWTPSTASGDSVPQLSLPQPTVVWPEAVLTVSIVLGDAGTPMVRLPPSHGKPQAYVISPAPPRRRPLMIQPFSFDRPFCSLTLLRASEPGTLYTYIACDQCADIDEHLAAPRTESLESRTPPSLGTPSEIEATVSTGLTSGSSFSSTSPGTTASPQPQSVSGRKQQIQ